ncbi:MAG: hypothetical protein ACI3XD_00790 [Oscillospiraceae bacterium]
MNETPQQNEFLQTMNAIALSPAVVENEITTQTYNKLPLSRLAALGTGLEPIAAAIQQVTSKGQAVSGYYKVTIPEGTHLASFKNEASYLGTALSDSSNGLIGQARLNPLVCDPTMLLVAATLANIDKKLDTLQETQQEMLTFMIQKEKSELKGNLEFLTDVFNNYKYNWNDEKFKASNHTVVLDVRKSSGQKIDFYREQIKKHLQKKALFHSDQDVKKQLTQVQDEFKNYQLALYLYGFAYFLEVLLQGNFDAPYLNLITTKLDALAFQYHELYSVSYTQIENRLRSSLQGRMFSGLSIANKTAGEVIGKIPVVRKSQLDETLIQAGRKIGSHEETRFRITMRQLVDRQNSCVRPFIDQINNINHVYNSPMVLIFNDETLYLGSA